MGAHLRPMPRHRTPASGANVRTHCAIAAAVTDRRRHRHPAPCRDMWLIRAQPGKAREPIWSRAECPDHRWRGHSARRQSSAVLSGFLPDQTRARRCGSLVFTRQRTLLVPGRMAGPPVARAYCPPPLMSFREIRPTRWTPATAAPSVPHPHQIFHQGRSPAMRSCFLHKLRKSLPEPVSDSSPETLFT